MSSPLDPSATTVPGFIINPIAGMGGRVGLKGTDGVAAEAVQRGAEPVANARALAMLQAFKRLLGDKLRQPAIHWLTADGEMGNDALRTAGFDAIEVVPSPIGAQGFVLSRGNQQLSPAVVCRIGAENIAIVSTPAKLARTLVLRFDSGMSRSTRK